MSTRRSTGPRRTATRRPQPAPAPVAAPAPAPEVDLAAADLATLVAVSLSQGVAAARTGLDAELEVAALFGPMSVVSTGVELADGVEEELLEELGHDEDSADDATSGTDEAPAGVAGEDEDPDDGPDEREDDDEVPDELELCLEVVEALVTRGDADALAALRALAALGLPPVHAAATEAADRLAATGLPERPWAASVGRPTPLGAWTWVEPESGHASLGVLYTERGRDHALLVVADPEADGGVRDLGLLTGRRADDFRTEMRTSLPDEERVVETVPLEDVPGLLAAVLEVPVCPGTVEQVDDVTELLMLVRARSRG